MKLDILCPHWGSESLDFTAFCRRVVEAGYDGVEISFEPDQMDTLERVAILKDHGLSFVVLHGHTFDIDIDTHVKNFRRRMEWAAATSPLFINTQTGRDWFSQEDNERIINVATEVAAATGVRIVHETHRGKFSFCAAVTQRFLLANPELRLAVDFSHWCNVSESLLEDQEAAVSLAIERADHIHARVGFQEGPQISDPRAPENKTALNAHLSWWDRIIEKHRSRGTEVFTITPEFGPYPYMPEQPFTREPAADQWDVNVFMMNLLRERYKLPA